MTEKNPDPYSLINRLAFQAIDGQRSLRPVLFASYKGVDNEHCIRDTQYHLTFLFDAASIGAPELFVNYVAWARVLLKHLNIEPDIFLENLQFIQKECRKELRQPFAGQVEAVMQTVLDRFPSMSDTVPSFINGKGKDGLIASSYLRAILASDRSEAQRVITRALTEGMDIKEIYLTVFQKVQYEVGRQWQHRQVSVAQEHYATAVSQHLMAQLYPSLLSPGMKKGRVVVTCVGNEMHEMGARMVSDFLEMDGWDVDYLGSNTPTSSVISYLKQRKARLLMISATMGYNVKNVRDLTRSVRSDAELKDVKIVVGGYPFNHVSDLWRSVGADGTAADANEVVSVANRLGR